MFLGKSYSSMVSFIFTMSAMTWQPASVTSQSPKINFLIYCSIKFSVVITLNVWSGCFFGVPLRNLLRDLRLVHESFGSWEKTGYLILSSSSVVASQICGLNEPAPLPCKCLTNWLLHHVSVQQSVCVLLSSRRQWCFWANHGLPLRASVYRGY